MRHKGFNTLIEEMKEKQMALIEEYAQQGIPMAVIKLNIDFSEMIVAQMLEKQLKNENKQYEEQLKQNAVEEKL